MAITYNPEEYIAALGNLTPLMRDEIGGVEGIMDINGQLNIDNLNNFRNSYTSQQGYNMPVNIPLTDPTYRSGYDYARSIAGGMPMSQVIAPGVSYSPEQPGGYTQADLNLSAGITPPPPPPVYKEPDDPSFFGTGIGGVTIPGGRRDKMPPLRNIFGNMPATLPTVQEPAVQVPPQEFDIEQVRQDIADSGIDFTNLFGLPQAPDLSGFARIEDLPTFNPDELRQDILMSLPEQKMQDLSGFMTQDDINKAIAGIDMPTYQAPDLSAYDTRLAELEQNLAALQQPTGGRFSINQPQVRGLF